jgi:hypothetical protein
MTASCEAKAKQGPYKWDRRIIIWGPQSKACKFDELKSEGFPPSETQRGLLKPWINSVQEADVPGRQTGTASLEFRAPKA